MQYSNLYDIVQSGACESDDFDGSICEKKLRRETESITGKPIVHIKVKMDESLCKGLYLPHSEPLHEIFGTGETNLIVTADSLTDGWERFVFTKELMHAFDGGGVGNLERFIDLMNDLRQPPPPALYSQDMKEEVGAFWMALGVLCTDRMRLLLKDQKINKREIENKQVARKLRLPEERVFNYFIPHYEDKLSQFGASFGG